MILKKYWFQFILVVIVSLFLTPFLTQKYAKSRLEHVREIFAKRFETSIKKVFTNIDEEKFLKYKKLNEYVSSRNGHTFYNDVLKDFCPTTKKLVKEND